MSDILRLFVAILILTLGLAAYFLVVNALFSQRVARTKTIASDMPGRSFGIGLVNFAFFFVIAVILISVADKIDNGFFKGVVILPALLILAFLAIMLTFGLTGIANLIGERILPDAASWKQTVCGAVCLCFACALPFVGWFLLFPYLGFVGIGAFILGVFRREPKA
jgi:hypothetical protein